MGIFSRDTDRLINRMSEQIEDLSKRVRALEHGKEEFRVGESSFLHHWDNSPYPHFDPRPVVSIKGAIEKILDHLNLELTATEAVPVQISLKKKGAK
jgi:hypothetical protein